MSPSGQNGQVVSKGHKASPLAGFFQTLERICLVGQASYGTNQTELRASILFHLRPQPNIRVSEGGRSATRARLLQPLTSTTRAGISSLAKYHDRVLLEDGKWKLLSATIDDFHWQSLSYMKGWSMADPRNSNQSHTDAPAWTERFPPDVTIADVGERERTFSGGSGRLIE